ncbi:MAG: head-tail adaptor protein [Chelatococcus sp.]|nr:MAG: head-tail adaptor protein [Chelatococcus sp.]
MAASDWKQPAIGAMRRRLLLEAPLATPDALGGATHQFVTVAALWARVEWLSGGERWRFGRPEQIASHRITMRWRAGVDAGQRLRDGDRVYEIRTAADPQDGRRRLVCLAEEIKP